MSTFNDLEAVRNHAHAKLVTAIDDRKLIRNQLAIIDHMAEVYDLDQTFADIACQSGASPGIRARTSVKLTHAELEFEYADTIVAIVDEYLGYLKELETETKSCKDDDEFDAYLDNIGDDDDDEFEDYLPIADGEVTKEGVGLKFHMPKDYAGACELPGGQPELHELIADTVRFRGGKPGDRIEIVFKIIKE